LLKAWKMPAPDAWRWQPPGSLGGWHNRQCSDTPANQKLIRSPRRRSRVGFPLVRVVVLLTLATATLVDAASALTKAKKRRNGVAADAARLAAFPGRSRGRQLLLLLLVSGDARAKGPTASLPPSHATSPFSPRRDDQEVVWYKPQRHEWMDKATYATLPKSLTLRGVRTQIREDSARDWWCDDADRFQTIQGRHPHLFHDRWQVELDLRVIKQSLQMEMLRCQTARHARKEIWAHLLAYNLVQGHGPSAMEAQLNPRQSVHGQGANAHAFGIRCWRRRPTNPALGKNHLCRRRHHRARSANRSSPAPLNGVRNSNAR